MKVVISREEVVRTAAKWGIVGLVLAMAAWLGSHPSLWWLALFAVVVGVIVLLQRPYLGLLGLVGVALVLPFEIGTGTAVMINPGTLLVPALLGLWVLDMMRQGDVHLAPSRVNQPLALFLLAGLFSLLFGIALWDPVVPRSGGFTIVQLAQWAIFAFSAGAFWLVGNQVQDQAWLRRLVLFFLAFGGGLAILLVLFQLLGVPALSALLDRVVTLALYRSPFWMMLAALAGGQLLFNQDMSARWRWFLLVAAGAVLVYAFYLERGTASNWVAVGAVIAVLAWLRWPQLRGAAIALLVILAVSGVLSSVIYDFAGGDDEWAESGGSRLTLIGRVVEVTMRNPVTGLGPAAYRRYAAMKPLRYGRAFYAVPSVSSHNNYVDLFAHVGLVGLGIFAWFAAELTMLGFRLRARFAEGFAAGYVNAMLAAWAGALVLMAFADWILPFVYNIGFPGFQASVLVWLFLGGLVALDQMSPLSVAAGQTAGSSAGERVF